MLALCPALYPKFVTLRLLAHILPVDNCVFSYSFLHSCLHMISGYEYFLYAEGQGYRDEDSQLLFSVRLQGSEIHYEIKIKNSRTCRIQDFFFGGRGTVR